LTCQLIVKNMKTRRINDTELLRLIDEVGLTQADAAKEIGVSRQAVNRRYIDLRGKTTRAVVVKKVGEIVENKIDAIEQLYDVNAKVHTLMEKAETDDDRPTMLRCMAEIRQQLDLQLKIYATLYDLQAVEEFQNAILETIREVSPDVRERIIHKLNQNRAIRQAVKFS